MDDHPPKAPATFVGEPLVQAHVRVPDSVNRSDWLRRKSGGRRRRSVRGSSPRAARGASTEGRGNPAADRNFSPPPRDRDVSVDSRTSSIASSTSTTISRLSMVSAPPRQPKPRQDDNGGHKPGSRRYGGAVLDRGRRRVSFDEGPPRSAAATSAAVVEALSSSRPSSTRCTVCQADFTRYRRPHRCRACGEAVCATCSPARMPKRTCKRCAGGSAAPRVAATISPSRQAVASPYAPPTGVSRAARRSVGSSARVLVAGAPSKPTAMVAGVTYSARASAVQPKDVGKGELDVLRRPDSSSDSKEGTKAWGPVDGLVVGPPSKPAAVVAGGTHSARACASLPKEVGKGKLDAPSVPDSSANASKERTKISGHVDGGGGGEPVDRSDLLGGTGQGKLGESTTPMEDDDEEMGGLNPPDGDRVETVGALGNAGHNEDATKLFPNGVLSDNSPNRMVRKSKTAAGPDEGVAAVSASTGRGVLPSLPCSASDDTERQVVCGPEATTADVNANVSSEEGGGGDRELEDAVGSCLPAGSPVNLSTSAVVDADCSHKAEVLQPPGIGQGAPEVMHVVDGEGSRKDEILKPPVGEQIAPEVVTGVQAAAAAASCATATPSPSSPDPPERAEDQLATTNPEELVLEPYPMNSAGEQPEMAPSTETANKLERAAAQPAEEGVLMLQQGLLRPSRKRLSFEDYGRVEEEGEEEAGLSVFGAGERGADENATAVVIESTSSPADWHKQHKEEEEVGKEHEDGVAHEVGGNSVDGAVNSGQEGAEDVLAAAAEFDAEGSVNEGLSRTDRTPPDMDRDVAHVSQDKPETELQWNSSTSKEAVIEEIDHPQHQEQLGVMRAPVAGLLLGSGCDEELVAARRGDVVSTAAQQGGEGGHGADKDAKAAAPAVDGEHGVAVVNFSTAGGESDGESRVSKMAVEPHEAAGLIFTPLADEDAERGASSQDSQVGSEEKDSGVDAATEEVLSPTLGGQGDKGSGSVDSDTEGSRGPPSAPLSLDNEERARGQDEGATEDIAGGKDFRDLDGRVADRPIVAPVPPQYEEMEGGVPQRAKEPPVAPSSGVHEGAGDGIDVGPSAAAGEDCGGKSTPEKLVVPPPASRCSSPTARIETRHEAVDGDAASSPGGIVLAHGGGERAGGFLGALKELMQKGGSCCR
eukprot:g3623.t1